MNKLWPIIALFALSMTLGAQNNPYGIDDACYAIFSETEVLVGKGGFDAANARLLSKAIEGTPVGDFTPLDEALGDASKGLGGFSEDIKQPDFRS